MWVVAYACLNNWVFTKYVDVSIWFSTFEFVFKYKKYCKKQALINKSLEQNNKRSMVHRYALSNGLVQMTQQSLYYSPWTPQANTHVNPSLDTFPPSLPLEHFPRWYSGFPSAQHCPLQAYGLIFNFKHRANGHPLKEGELLNGLLLQPFQSVLWTAPRICWSLNYFA